MSEDDSVLPDREDVLAAAPGNAPGEYDAILLAIPSLLVVGLLPWLLTDVSFRVAAGVGSVLASVVVLHGLLGSPPVEDG